LGIKADFPVNLVGILDVFDGWAARKYNQSKTTFFLENEVNIEKNLKPPFSKPPTWAKT
jgi:hypothetical protein